MTLHYLPSRAGDEFLAQSEQPPGTAFQNNNTRPCQGFGFTSFPGMAFPIELFHGPGFFLRVLATAPVVFARPLCSSARWGQGLPDGIHLALADAHGVN